MAMQGSGSDSRGGGRATAPGSARRKRTPAAPRDASMSRTRERERGSARDGRSAAGKAAAPGAEGSPRNELTIEQLAGAVGMSVRNIRNHHTRGLLPAPEVRARVGYYNADHVARLRLILDLQA